MSWVVACVANAVIAGVYFAIVWVIVGGLIRTGQTRSNALALTTAAIFLTCAVHHGAQTVHLLLPLVGPDVKGEAMRTAAGWPMSIWDVLGAAVGLYYLNIRASFGRLLQTPSMFRDMSQARVDEAIAAEHEALNEAQAMGRMGSWRRDLVSGAWETSAEFRRIVGIDEGQTPRVRWEEVHPDDRDELRRTLDAARVGIQGEASFRMVREPGHKPVRLHARARGEFDADGRVVAVAGTLQDVTREAAMEEAVTAAELRFRTAFEAAPIGVGLVALHASSQARFVSANAALGRLLDEDAARLVGTPLAALIHHDDLTEFDQALTAAQRDGSRGAEVELRLVRRDQKELWVVMTAALLPNGSDGRRLAVVNVMDVSQRKQFEGRLQHLADHDALTGLFNRRRFTEEIERTLAGTQRFGEAGAILFVDLDGFKFVNDWLGHAIGDDLIARVGATFAREVRATDVLARVGGDEFALILPRTSCEEAVAVAEKLLAAMAREGTIEARDRTANVSASIGISTFVQGDGTTPDELLVEADLAMYAAKAAGKNRWSVFERGAADQPRRSVREGLSRRLLSAVEEGRFVLHAQPIVAFDDEGPPCFELLLRLPDDHDDLLPPGSFLPHAERFGLMTRIDEWVIDQAVGLLADSHGAGFPLSLSINVSATTLTAPGIEARVAGLLAAHPIPPGALTIELTETAAITNIGQARGLAHALRELGCRIALDDFGAGFASFYYLKHLEFDDIKIDGEFIRQLCSTSSDELVVRAVVDVARGLGKRTIAEFVGDDATVALLTEIGVDAGQGYHLGRPAPLDTRLPHLLARSAGVSA